MGRNFMKVIEVRNVQRMHFLMRMIESGNIRYNMIDIPAFQIIVRPSEEKSLFLRMGLTVTDALSSTSFFTCSTIWFTNS